MQNVERRNRRKEYPDPKYLAKILDYDELTGILTWSDFLDAENCKRKRTSGKVALNSIEPTGYLRGTINGEQYKAHVVCWGIYYGSYPQGEIDHINGDKTDNRIENLRETSRSENQCNISLRASNTSGFKGASWKKKNGKWQAQICKNGKTKYLGLHNSAYDAHMAYLAASAAIHGEYGKGN